MAQYDYFFDAQLDENQNLDRVYSADDFVSYLQGLISDGVFAAEYDLYDPRFDMYCLNENLAVTVDGLTVTVHSGMAWIGGRKFMNTQNATFTLPAANPVVDKEYFVRLKVDIENRCFTLSVDLFEDDDWETYSRESNELILAYIIVPANSSEAYRRDLRAYSTHCGFVRSIVSDVGNEILEREWLQLLERTRSDMSSWQQEEQQRFNSWLSSLTNSLFVNCDVSVRKGKFILGENQTVITPLISGYTFKNGDNLAVYINGLRAFGETTLRQVTKTNQNSGFSLEFNNIDGSETEGTEIIIEVLENVPQI